ncbi:MAG: glutamine amidotransferase [Acidobacteria bacterium]|nr:glutamine amidotransferase [Acidobacteriota bacterium]
MTNPIRIVHLYPREMNIYGDRGNVLTLARRLEWHGYAAQVIPVNRGDRLPTGTDLIVGGGGQDSGQGLVVCDLARLGPDLAAMADDAVPMLMVCGLYQLFGHAFRTGSGTILHGIGVLDIETMSSPRRMIGNVVARSDDFGQIIGYENHSGRTTLGPRVRPLGRVDVGVGNNGTDGTEGARFNNLIGTYLHGSLLPKNPAIADHLIQIAVRRRFDSAQLRTLDESLSDEARRVALTRPR